MSLQQLPDAGPGGLSWRRRWWGVAVAVIGPVLLTGVLIGFRGELRLDAVLLFFVLVAVTSSVVGGVLPAILASAVGFALATFFFTVPYGSLIVADPGELIDLLVFVAVAVLVGVITEVGARSRGRAEHERARAEMVAELGTAEAGPQSVDRLLEATRNLFDMNAASLVRNGEQLVRAGHPRAGDEIVDSDAGDGLVLELSCPVQLGHDRVLLDSLALTTGRLWRTERLAEQARRAEELTRIDELRSSLLAAVGHDLRNPLAAIRAAAATLGETDLELEPDERAELLETIDTHADKLNAIIANLLDLSRLQAGALSVQLGPVMVLEALGGVLGVGGAPVRLDLPDDLPPLLADAGLLERVLANLVDNAARYQIAGTPVVIRAAARGRRIVVQVVDNGPGVDPGRLAEIFRPFQHFGDRSANGVGLGLAIARGFTDAMGGTLSADQTPGGGLTMTVELEVADGAHPHR